MTPRDPDLYTRYTLPMTAQAPTSTQAAIAAYVAYRDDPVLERAPTPAEVRLVAQYCQEWIRSPYLPIYPSEEFCDLVFRVVYIRTVQELADWLWDCRRIGIEPL